MAWGYGLCVLVIDRGLHIVSHGTTRTTSTESCATATARRSSTPTPSHLSRFTAALGPFLRATDDHAAFSEGIRHGAGGGRLTPPRMVHAPGLTWDRVADALLAAR